MSIGTLLMRVDVGVAVGVGHLMRCLALAEAWRSRGGDVLVVVPDGVPDGLHDRVISTGCDLLVVAEEPLNEGWLLEAERRDAAWLVLDGYGFGPEVMDRARRSGRPVLVIDDDARWDRYPVSMLLNQNLHAWAGAYSRKTVASLLLGPRHALIRSEFRGWTDWQRKIPSCAKNVLVTLGGADSGGHTERVVLALRAVGGRSSENELKVRAVVGGANPRLDRLRDIAGMETGVEILSNVRDMAELMRWCDVAVSASGSTVWELALLKTPMLLATASKVEEPVASSLGAAEAALVLGRLDDLDIEAIAAAVAGILPDKTLRARLSGAAANLVDGNGVERVVDQMLAISSSTG
jgi:UDP-2,4-diacetamido-2,4,6-trideoxy-beta-L-altropyranose hydrolase